MIRKAPIGVHGDNRSRGSDAPTFGHHESEHERVRSRPLDRVPGRGRDPAPPRTYHGHPAAPAPPGTPRSPRRRASRLRRFHQVPPDPAIVCWRRLVATRRSAFVWSRRPRRHPRRSENSGSSMPPAVAARTFALPGDGRPPPGHRRIGIRLAIGAGRKAGVRAVRFPGALNSAPRGEARMRTIGWRASRGDVGGTG